MCEAIVLAKYTISKCVKDGQPVSNLQLQKILYYIQEAFVKKDKVAFLENIEAWQFGPVVPCVYYRFSGNGSMPITTEYDVCLEKHFEQEEIRIIDFIIDEKRTLDPWVLVEETHKPGGPWDIIYRNGEGNKDIISREVIKKYS